MKYNIALTLMVALLMSYAQFAGAWLGSIVQAPFDVAADVVDYSGQVAGAATDTALSLGTLGWYDGYGYPYSYSYPSYSYSPRYGQPEYYTSGYSEPRYVSSVARPEPMQEKMVPYEEAMEPKAYHPEVMMPEAKPMEKEMAPMIESKAPSSEAMVTEMKPMAKEMAPMTTPKATPAEAMVTEMKPMTKEMDLDDEEFFPSRSERMMDLSQAKEAME